ncbi:DUF1206 domain-containing protein [Terrihabitans sp. B22-R8]|uniref:DUF1206 domain-containing protein n=1 Tax=Terrihabitans sp. B22-R8 TaxID=3425128 RepID=UPI00403C9AC7
MALARTTIERMARFGFAARGAVYIVVGALALLAAIGSGGRATGSKGALQEVLLQPFGSVILALVALGLLAFAAWRIIEAGFDADDHGTGPKGIVVRAAHVFSAIVNTGLALSAIGLLIGTATASGEDGSVRDWTSFLMQQPFGRWMLGAIGAGTIVGGGVMFVAAAKAAFLKRLDCPENHAGWIRSVGRIGYAARGVTFLIIGGFLIVAAVTYDSSAAHGLGGALKELQVQPYGWALLGLVAIGLAAFGMFGLVQARYRAIHPPEKHDLPEFARA